MFGIDSTPFAIVLAVIVGALLLMAGIFVGVWIARREQQSTEQENVDLLSLMSQLSQLTNTFSGDFSNHQKVLMDMSSEMERLGNQSGLDDVKSMIDRMNVANQQLNSRLQEVQQELDEKALEVNNLLSESRTDALTSLPNRRAFNEEIHRRTSEVSRYGGEVSFVILDVDHFKSFNDTHGHLVGDEVLQRVAGVIRQTIRESDFPARMGGEEFGVLLNSTGLQEAAQGADRLRQAIEKAKLVVDDLTLSITVSMGVTAIQNGELTEVIVDRADKALYAAKEGGRNQVWVNDEGTLKRFGDAKKTLVPNEMKDVANSLRERLIKTINN